MDDFRSSRFKLPPEAFVYAPGPEPKPSDPVDEATWRGIVALPDDVSLRTSDHHGELLKAAHGVWGHWIGLVLDVQALVADPKEDPLALACLIVSDELQASIHAAMTGFYRQSIAGLRAALEAVLVGAYFHAIPDADGYRSWADGRREGQLWMRDLRDRLSAVEPYRRFESSSGGEPTDQCRSLLGRSGWVDFLYSHLSGFSHGRPFYLSDAGNRLPSSNVGLWGGSNGPVYEPRSVRLWSSFFFDTGLLSLLLVGLAEGQLIVIDNPVDIPYINYLERMLTWHFGPPPVAREIVAYLVSGPT